MIYDLAETATRMVSAVREVINSAALNSTFFTPTTGQMVQVNSPGRRVLTTVSNFSIKSRRSSRGPAGKRKSCLLAARGLRPNDANCVRDWNRHVLR